MNFPNKLLLLIYCLISIAQASTTYECKMFYNPSSMTYKFQEYLKENPYSLPEYNLESFLHDEFSLTDSLYENLFSQIHTRDKDKKISTVFAAINSYSDKIINPLNILRKKTPNEINDSAEMKNIVHTLKTIYLEMMNNKLYLEGYLELENKVLSDYYKLLKLIEKKQEEINLLKKELQKNEDMERLVEILSKKFELFEVKKQNLNQWYQDLKTSTYKASLLHSVTIPELEQEILLVETQGYKIGILDEYLSNLSKKNHFESYHHDSKQANQKPYSAKVQKLLQQIEDPKIDPSWKMHHFREVLLEPYIQHKSDEQIRLTNAEAEALFLSLKTANTNIAYKGPISGFSKYKKHFVLDNFIWPKDTELTFPITVENAETDRYKHHLDGLTNNFLILFTLLDQNYANDKNDSLNSFTEFFINQILLSRKEFIDRQSNDQISQIDEKISKSTNFIGKFFLNHKRKKTVNSDHSDKLLLFMNYAETVRDYMSIISTSIKAQLFRDESNSYFDYVIDKRRVQIKIHSDSKF